jgi:C-terminal processing protease CtpA/Prc
MDYDAFRAWAGDEAIRLPARPGAMWLAHQDEAWWTTYLPDSRTLYAQYNEVREAGSSMAADLDEIMDAHPVDRVVIDLRHNVGGDNTTYGALLDRLAKPDADRPNRLLALIGRTTFSAAGNFATDLERETGVVFVGEPTGGAPNMYGDVRSVTLPYSGLTAFISSIYWQRSDPDDPRLAIAPDVAVGLSSPDYFADRDPALDAALTYGG